MPERSLISLAIFRKKKATEEFTLKYSLFPKKLTLNSFANGYLRAVIVTVASFKSTQNVKGACMRG